MVEKLEKQLEFQFMKETKVADLVIKYICSQQKPQQMEFQFMRENRTYTEKKAERIGEAIILAGTYLFIGVASLLNRLKDYRNQR